jgi:hypothetical protein
MDRKRSFPLVLLTLFAVSPVLAQPAQQSSIILPVPRPKTSLRNATSSPVTAPTSSAPRTEIFPEWDSISAAT